MRPALLFLISAIALPVAASTAHADQASAALPRANPPSLMRPAADTARLQRLLAEADEASVAGRAGHARKVYRTLVQEQKEAQLYAGTALWRLAGVQLFEGKKYDAALVLAELADEAARYGDPTMELRATFEAAILWQQLKRPELSQQHLERVRCLLQSPAIAADVKAGVEGRIVG